MKPVGKTDSGEPLHLVIYNAEGVFDFDQIHAAGKPVLFVNNGIHPGEPDGIDASMMLLRDMASGKVVNKEVVVAFVPVYNIGGHLNRSAFNRVNQNGPIERGGFRGNAQNLNLNRDFMKTDALNTLAFYEIFHELKPDYYIETHVSNGADYQHVMTLLPTQHNKLGGTLGDYLKQEMLPYLYADMKQKDFPMIPYVNAYGATPENGWAQFNDPPRFSSGFAALFHTIGFITETHMLKPYDQRTASTYEFIRTVIESAKQDGARVKEMRKSTANAVKTQKDFALEYVPNREKPSKITFMGYEAAYKPSEISGKPRLYYDRTKPFTKEINFYDHFEPRLIIEKPKAYIIPQGWHEVIRLLEKNGVQLSRLTEDQEVEVGTYYIEDFKTASSPFEKHYLHSDIKVRKVSQKVKFRKGDYRIELNQSANRYIIEALEPQGPDSFFAWNFFDAILASKEGYSAYIFEDLAAEWLAQNPAIQKELEAAKAADEKLAENGNAQLRWVYERSPWKEKEHMRYPVFRVEGN